MHFTSFFSSSTRPAGDANRTLAADRNDLRDDANVLGTVCGVHGCQRMLDEAPIVPPANRRDELAQAKRDLFPNSWRAIASLTPPTRGGWFSRHRTRTVAVRYCEQCRDAAEKWMQEHQES